LIVVIEFDAEGRVDDKGMERAQCSLYERFMVACFPREVL
jgi:hypothetical protein